jgi:putative flippase GtrA
LVLRYTLFAVIATLANLAAQRLVLSQGTSTLYFAVAVGAGTLIGLLLKYLLDKRWIFYDRRTGLKNHGERFWLYSATGAVTTALFWGMETAFWLTWHTDKMREIGAVIGLMAGYILKYNLDRRYVFADVQNKLAL